MVDTYPAFFYERLIDASSRSWKEFQDVFKIFSVWWKSLAGQFSLESAMNDYIQDIYYKLVELLEKREALPPIRLTILLIYDSPFTNVRSDDSYFSIIPIQQFLIGGDALIPRLDKLID